MSRLVVCFVFLGWLSVPPLANSQASPLHRNDIVRAFRKVWHMYQQSGFGSDELKPVSGDGVHSWGGFGLTLVDSLDTLWLMGMAKEFSEARDWVRDSLDFSKDHRVNLFETNIRLLGGLLGAYTLSKDSVFLSKAEDLAARLTAAFESQHPVPFSDVNLKTRAASFAGTAGSLSEFGSLQLEFKTLSEWTGHCHYAQLADSVLDWIAVQPNVDGLFPSLFFKNHLKGKVTLGARGDSFYEYLLKEWLLTGRRDTLPRELYDASVNGIASRLLLRSTPSLLLYVAELEDNQIVHKMDHLVGTLHFFALAWCALHWHQHDNVACRFAFCPACWLWTILWYPTLLDSRSRGNLWKRVSIFTHGPPPALHQKSPNFGR